MDVNDKNKKIKILCLKPFPYFVWNKREYYGCWYGDVKEYPEKVSSILIKRGFAVQVEAERRWNKLKV